MRVKYKEIEDNLCSEGRRIAKKIFGKRKALEVNKNNIKEYAQKIGELYWGEGKVANYRWGLGRILYDLLWCKVSEKAAQEFNDIWWVKNSASTLLSRAKKLGLEL